MDYLPIQQDDPKKAKNTKEPVVIRPDWPSAAPKLPELPQVAPTPPKKKNNRKKIIIGVIILSVLFLLVLVIIAGSTTNNNKSKKNNQNTTQSLIPTPASATSLQQMNTSISNDMSSLDNTNDFSSAKIDDQSLGID